MKKLMISVLALTAGILCSCSSKQANEHTIEADIQALDSLIQYWNTCEEEITDSMVCATFEEYYNYHKADSLGLNLFGQLAGYWDLETLKQHLSEADTLIINNARVQRYVAAKEKALATAPGKHYIDVRGTDALTSDSLALSDLLATGKPLIVDFWASWCGPCRREITNHLSKYAEQYKDKVNFVGVAVWENSVEDTRKAMASLPVSWPVIFAGGRTDSPTEAYGIMSIPHIMLIAPDGTILYRDLYGEAIAKAIDECLQDFLHQQ